MVFADPKNIEANLIGQLNFLEQVLHSIHWGKDLPCDRVRNGRREAVDSDLHEYGSCKLVGI
jgi:hypothetical protein